MKSKIVVFACNWCSPISMDFEEVQGIPIIRLMCSGRFHSALVLKAFELGARGVLIVGCEEGKCHYGSGNKVAKEQIEKAQNLLQLLGKGGQKIRCEFIHRDAFGETISKFIGEAKN